MRLEASGSFLTLNCDGQSSQTTMLANRSHLRYQTSMATIIFYQIAANNHILLKLDLGNLHRFYNHSLFATWWQSATGGLGNGCESIPTRLRCARSDRLRNPTNISTSRCIAYTSCHTASVSVNIATVGDRNALVTAAIGLWAVILWFWAIALAMLLCWFKFMGLTQCLSS